MFKLITSFAGRTYTNTLTWRGRLTVATRPTLCGSLDSGAWISVAAGRWSDGWRAEADRLGIEACPTAAGVDCVMLAGEQLSCGHSGGCGSSGGSPNTPSDHVQISKRYVGWYLFGLDAHVVEPISLSVGHEEHAIPPWPLTNTGVRSQPYGPVNQAP